MLDYCESCQNKVKICLKFCNFFLPRLLNFESAVSNILNYSDYKNQLLKYGILLLTLPENENNDLQRQINS